MMTLKGGTSNACAACKYQRRKCTPECQLAPFFPADKPETFKNAHRLFGVKNILSILKTLQDPIQRSEAMTSIIFQANVRQVYPVHGCCQLIDTYCSQIRLAEEELHAIYSQLEFFRAQQHSQVRECVLTVQTFIKRLKKQPRMSQSWTLVFTSSFNHHPPYTLHALDKLVMFSNWLHRKEINPIIKKALLSLCLIFLENFASLSNVIAMIVFIFFYFFFLAS